MNQNMPPDIQRIIAALKQRDMQVTGPIPTNGESVYRINEHALTEGEIRTLAVEDQLTTWGIYSYVKTRDQNRTR
ncbi:MAG TPA: hypothetical protein VG322_07030 [Candidatus Acidoferrales bacterium]|jgi:hypothetical protein|nr:hypothetical protein [Candidatus Acidoferrales bacterium]